MRGSGRSGHFLDGLGAVAGTCRFTALVASPDERARDAMVVRLAQLGATTVLETANGATANELVRRVGPCDVAVLDVTPTRGDNVRLIQGLRRAGCRAVVVLVSPDSSSEVVEVSGAGVSSILVKAQAGWNDDVAAERVREYLRGITSGPLTHREVQVLQLVAAGQNTREIAAALLLSPLTVKSHVERIGRKLNTGDRAAMVANAMRKRLIW